MNNNLLKLRLSEELLPFLALLMASTSSLVFMRCSNLDGFTGLCLPVKQMQCCKDPREMELILFVSLIHKSLMVLLLCLCLFSTKILIPLLIISSLSNKESISSTTSLTILSPLSCSKSVRIWVLVSHKLVPNMMLCSQKTKQT